MVQVSMRSSGRLLHLCVGLGQYYRIRLWDQTFIPVVGETARAVAASGVGSGGCGELCGFDVLQAGDREGPIGLLIYMIFVYILQRLLNGSYKP